MLYRLIIITIILLQSTLVLYGGTGCSSSNWSTIVCPPGKGEQEGKEVTLDEVNVIRGTATCVIDKGGNHEELKIIDNDCDESIAKDVSSNKGDAMLSHSKSNMEKYMNRMENRGVIFDKSLIDSLKKSPILSDIQKLQDLAKQGGDAYKKAFSNMVKSLKADSRTDYSHTLAAILAGTFTLDPDYFKKGYINGAGEISLKPEFTKLQSVSKDATTLIGGVFKWFSQIFSKDDGVKEQISSIGPISFMDKQVLGYFVIVSEGLRKVYDNLSMILAALGVLFSIGYYAFRKTLEKYGNEPFQSNQLSFFASLAFAIMFFTAPIIHDGELSPSNGTFKFQNKEDAKNWSSLAQEAIRQTVQTSTYFANYSADIVMQGYLQLLAYKMGVINISESEIKAKEGRLLDAEKLKIGMLKELDFYEEVCRPYFELKEDELFSKQGTQQRLGDINNNNNEGKGKAFLQSKQIEADLLGYDGCSIVEAHVAKTLYSSLKRHISLAEEIKSQASFINANVESIEKVTGLFTLLTFSHNMSGWVFVPVIPVSYFYFSNSDLFLYSNATDDTKQISIAEGIVNADNNAKARSEDKDVGVGAIAEEGLKSILGSSIVKSTFWFIVPGFSELYKSLKEQLQGMYISTVDIYNANLAKKKSEDGAAKDILAKGVKKLSKLVNKASWVGKIISTLLDVIVGSSGEKSSFVYAALGIIAFYISVILITYMVSLITIMVVSAYLSFQVVMYFIEVLLTFFTAPFLGVYFAFMSKGSTKNYLSHFGVTLGVLFASPILIVLIGSLLIPISMLFDTIFGQIMAIIMAVLDVGSQSLTDALTSSTPHEGFPADIGDAATRVSTSMDRIMTTTSLQGMVMIFSKFSTLVLSVVMIHNYKDWFTQKAGLDGGMNMTKETTSEIKSGVAGKALNPVG